MTTISGKLSKQQQRELVGEGRIIVVGVGHRARQGKDITASFIQKIYPHVHILHFADELYAEVKNRHGIETNKPLVILKDQYAFLLNNANDVDGDYILLNGDRPRHREYVSQLYTLLEHGKSQHPQNTSTVYWGMGEKDAPMLQFWGTDFRRQQNERYWVNKIREHILSIYQNATRERWEDVIILIPDLRFENELTFIRSYFDGYYLRLTRLNEDGTQFIDPSRSPDHPSESSLEGFEPDFEISATSGDLLKIHTEARFIMEKIING